MNCIQICVCILIGEKEIYVLEFYFFFFDREGHNFQLPCQELFLVKQHRVKAESRDKNKIKDEGCLGDSVR